MTSYNAEQIKDIILSCLTCITFTYRGKDCNIDPFPPDHFHIYCDGDEWDVSSIDEVMQGQFFDEMCLRDIAQEIQDFSW